MYMPGFGLGCGLRVRPRVKPSYEHRLQFKQLLKLQLELRHPEFPQAIRGLDGMIAADDLLRERDASGLLIGGLSEAVWNARRTPEQLAEHKDVDVLVFDTDFKLHERFEKGIDWWLPEDRKVTVQGDYSRYEMTVRPYTNGNGVMLHYSVNKRYSVEPGLYIPSPPWVKEMRLAETLASVAASVSIEDEAIDLLEKKIESKMATKVPGYIARRFPGQILKYDDYAAHWQSEYTAEIMEFELRVIAALNGTTPKGQL
jgi:hypothetical protein